MRANWIGVVVQVIEHLLCKCKAQSTIFSPTTKNKTKKRKTTNKTGFLSYTGAQRRNTDHLLCSVPTNISLVQPVVSQGQGFGDVEPLARLCCALTLAR
jgi:hypothetical protein